MLFSANKDKYSISAICAVLKIPRSTYYYESKSKPKDDSITSDIIRIFKDSKNNYGTRKIKIELDKEGITASRRLIGRIMKQNGLVSTYTVSQYKVFKFKVNEEEVNNEVNREHLEAFVSDLTYVRVDGKWNYVCIILDLYNREIIGHSAGSKKDAALVHQAFASITHNLNNISIFHTDRGSEFKNSTIDSLMETFKIKRSLSKKGCPYDNAVAEAAFKVFKTEFAYQHTFSTLEQLKVELFDYVNWYNNIRIHFSLDYLTPIEYKKTFLKEIV